MPFVKIVKNKAYFKRYQVKYRRRREGKTDYRARKRLIAQDKNKYNSPKYRLVVRFSNRYVLCQVAYAQIEGDKIVASASSSELPRYGYTAGLKNYAAAYSTGLLLARRLLTQLGLSEAYVGQEKVTGEVVKSEQDGRTFFVDGVDGDKRPFKALLDVGIITTTTGHRVFGAMKGATDGGLDIPHNEKRFPGYNKETKAYDAGVHRQRIFGDHVADYMKILVEKDNAQYAKQFSKYIEKGLSADDIEDMITKVHAAIRADPAASAKKTDLTFDKKFQKKAKMSYAQRKDRIKQKKEANKRKVAKQEAADASAEMEVDDGNNKAVAETKTSGGGDY